MPADDVAIHNRPSDPSVHASHAVTLVRDGVVTLAVLMLAFAAFDDITTDNDTNFTLEYVALLACAGWLLVVTTRLLRESHRVLGAISCISLASAVWAQSEIGPRIVAGPWPAYVVTASAFLWFTVVAVVLLVSGWRTHPERHTQRA